MDNIDKIKSSKKIIDQVLNTETKISHRTRTIHDINKKKFESIITNLEQIELRSHILNTDFSIDLSKYEDIYHNVIDNMFELLYSPEALKLIKFYLYGRIDANGESVRLEDTKGNEIPLDNITQLYNLIQNMNA